MPLKWFGGRRGKTVPAPTPGERVVYAVGDIHGRLDLLEPLLATIDEDIGASDFTTPPVLIFVGDYIDRGPASKAVVDRLIALKADARFEVRTLKGNHEDALLAFLQDAELGQTWAEYGALQTLQSYGVAPPPMRTNPAVWEKTREAFADALPPAHLAFFAGLELMATYGDYTFVHAGVRPGVALEDQDEHDLLCIRGEFLDARRPAETVIVHGHTPELEPYLGDERIGIDTGAYATSVLTAVKLAGAQRTILQARLSRGGQGEVGRLG